MEQRGLLTYRPRNKQVNAPRPHNIQVNKTARYIGIPLSRTHKGLEIERVQDEEKILNFH